MMETLSKNPEIRWFLNVFPKHQWRKCIEGGLVLGIRKIRKRTEEPLYSDILSIIGETQEDSVRAALSNMRKEIEAVSENPQTIERSQKSEQNLRLSKADLDYHLPLNGLTKANLYAKPVLGIPQTSYGNIPRPAGKKTFDYLKSFEVKSNNSQLISKAGRSNSAAQLDKRPARDIKEPNVAPIERVKSLKDESLLLKGNPFTSYLSGDYKYQ